MAVLAASHRLVRCVPASFATVVVAAKAVVFAPEPDAAAVLVQTALAVLALTVPCVQTAHLTLTTAILALVPTAYRRLFSTPVLAPTVPPAMDHSATAALATLASFALTANASPNPINVTVTAASLVQDSATDALL